MIDKLFYFHIPKTAGSSVKYILHRNIKAIYEDLNYYGYDYEKCLEFVKTKHPFIHSENLFPVENNYSRVTTHHNNSIPEEQCIEILKKIKRNGYSLLISVRNPIDLRCSFFHYFWQKLKLQIDKDDWCKKHHGIYKSSNNLSEWLDYSCGTDFLISPNLMKEFDFIIDVSSGGLEKINHVSNASKSPKYIPDTKYLYDKLFNTNDVKYYHQYYERFHEKITPLHLLPLKRTFSNIKLGRVAFG